MCVCVSIYILLSILDIRVPNSVSPRYRNLNLLNNNQMQCTPINAQQRSTLMRYEGPVTCTSFLWTVAFGGCTFSGDYAGAQLVRTGSCPTEGGALDLGSKGITSVPSDTFQNMTQMT